MKPFTLTLLFLLGSALANEIETISEAELQQLIASGQIEVVTSQSGQTVQEVSTGESEFSYGDQVYYARPFIAQTQEVQTKPLVE